MLRPEDAAERLALSGRMGMDDPTETHSQQARKRGPHRRSIPSPVRVLRRAVLLKT